MSETEQHSRPVFDRTDAVVPVYLFQLIKTVLRERNLDSDKLIEGSGISMAQLDREDTLLSFDQSLTIVNNALKLTQDDSLGLEIGRRESLSDWGMMGYAIASCRSGRDMLRIAQNFYQTTTNLTHSQIQLESAQLIARCEPYHQVKPELYRFLVEEHLACNHKMISDFHGNKHQPVEIHLRYPAPAYANRYESVFACPIIFNARSNQAIYPESVLDIVNPSANPVTQQLAVKLCEQLQQQQEQHRGIVNKVRLRIMSQPHCHPSPGEIAQQLGMSERSLRRQLKEQGNSYQQILDDVRAEIAIRYLRDSQLQLEDIAHLLGFSESSSFYRAFKKWTGKAPSSFRDK
ncbi:MAG: AraC family transcriptional regulator [Cellvibrionaceae bacterium]